MIMAIRRCHKLKSCNQKPYECFSQLFVANLYCRLKRPKINEKEVGGECPYLPVK